MAQHFNNVALIGASGNIGSRLLDNLVKDNKHNITVITRPSSSATYPASVTVKKGAYTDSTFLEFALKGNDVLVIMLGFGGLGDQDAIVEAAAKAGVEYVLPTDYGAALSNDKLLKMVPMFQGRRDLHSKIEDLGMKWVSVTTNGWTDYSLQYGFFNIEIPERRATLYTDSAPFNTTSLARVAEGITAFLSLPTDVVEEHFANNYLYLSSFVVTHPQIFDAVLRVTKTTEADWKIERKTTKELVDEGKEMMKNGQMAGVFKVIYGATYQPGMDGNYSHKVHNDLLGLKDDNLDEVVKSAVDAAQPGALAEMTALAANH